MRNILNEEKIALTGLRDCAKDEKERNVGDAGGCSGLCVLGTFNGILESAGQRRFGIHINTENHLVHGVYGHLYVGSRKMERDSICAER